MLQVGASCLQWSYLRWVNANMHGGTVSLLALDSLDVNDELFSVALQNFASLLTLVMAASDLEGNKNEKN